MNKCINHPKQDLFFFCLTCNKNSCLKCKEFSPCGHKLEYLKNFFKLKKENLSQKNQNILAFLDTFKKSNKKIMKKMLIFSSTVKPFVIPPPLRGALALLSLARALSLTMSVCLASLSLSPPLSLHAAAHW